MNQHILLLPAACLSVVLTLTACSGASSGQSGDGTLKLVAADYGDKASNNSMAYWDGVATAFEKQNPGIKVDVEVVDWNDIDAHA
ncbi:hypothetical protein AB5J72_49390 [Streptomyces sp. CG1]|uniref:hypothetical protein n=1 Tax=Streptomyces sp. CG1 TaxID=1287523 RepID=UPI0034E2F568